MRRILYFPWNADASDTRGKEEEEKGKKTIETYEAFSG